MNRKKMQLLAATIVATQSTLSVIPSVTYVPQQVQEVTVKVQDTTTTSNRDFSEEPWGQSAISAVQEPLVQSLPIPGKPWPGGFTDADLELW
mgnify:CR=1 FL=1